MDIRFEGPLPMRLSLNRWMFAGMAVFAVGAALWATEILSNPKKPTVLYTVAYGTVIAGIALYFIGRVVQLAAAFRSNRTPEPPHGE